MSADSIWLETWDIPDPPRAHSLARRTQVRQGCWQLRDLFRQPTSRFTHRSLVTRPLGSSILSCIQQLTAAPDQLLSMVRRHLLHPRLLVLVEALDAK